MERISSFFSHGLCTEKQNILLQHMHENEFFILTNKCGNKLQHENVDKREKSIRAKKSVVEYRLKTLKDFPFYTITRFSKYLTDLYSNSNT